MDALSRVLALYPLRTSLDVRCDVGAPWRLDQPAVGAGIAPYHLIVSGCATLDACGQKGMALQAGDIVMFPHGSAHLLHTGSAAAASALRPVDGAQVLRLLGNDGAGARNEILCGQFEFNDGQARGLLSALPEMIVVRTAGRDDFAGLAALLAMLRAETAVARPGASAVVAQLASALFALLMRAWLEQAAGRPGLFALLAERRLQPALQGMLDAPEHPWSLEAMAAACHMSRATFVRLFQRVAGASPATVLMQTRMARAAAALGDGGTAAGAVGEAVGYQSEAAFNRAFKRCFGVGPGQYRRDARRGAGVPSQQA